jgi:hypothetical protein
MKLDLGCGYACAPGYLGVDICPAAAVRMDMLDYLRQAETDSVDAARAHHSLEHITRERFKHLLRACKHGARIEVSVPYFTGGVNLGNPYHFTPFNEHTFRFFCRDKEDVHKAFGEMDWVRNHSFGLWGDSMEEGLPGYVRILSIAFNYHPDFCNKSEAEKEFARRHFLNVVLDMDVVLEVDKSPAA